MTHDAEADAFEDDFRVVRDETGWTFEVGIVEWRSPHTPQVRWRRFRRWTREPDAERLARARAAALATPRFFRRCGTCQSLCNAGHLFSADLCQGCASQHHGVVF